MASTVACLACSAATSSGFCAGQTKPISVAPGRSSATSSSVGGRTLKTMSARPSSAAAPSTTSAPAAR